MKELSIEEKAKAYDKAIERAKQHCADYVVETIFPELKESEDEKVRKEIVTYLKSIITNKGYKDIIIESWIAWLEKQDEQQDTSIQINPSEYINDMGGNECYLKNTLKPVDKIEPKFKVKYADNEYNVLEVRDIAGVTYYGIEDEPNHIDYVKAENCEIISGYAIKENGSPYPTNPAVFSEQNPAWSEEDERNLQGIIDEIEKKKNQAPGYDIATYGRFLSWLKSLKDRYTWNPSDEQMERLKGTINSLPHQGVLYSLYQDLKKLKG